MSDTKQPTHAPDTQHQQQPPPRPISTRHSTSHRHSKLPATPPPPLSIDPLALPAENALIVGTHPVSLAANAVVHPYARLDAGAAPIVLAEGAVVWEKACVGVVPPADGEGADDGAVEVAAKMEGGAGVTLGRNVTVGSCAVVEAVSVGEGSVVETGARLGRGCVIGEYCRIAPNLQVPPFTKVAPYTIVVAVSEAGALQTRTNVTARDNERVRALQIKGHEKQIEMMRKLLKVNLAKWTLQA